MSFLCGMGFVGLSIASKKLVGGLYSDVDLAGARPVRPVRPDRNDPPLLIRAGV